MTGTFGPGLLAQLNAITKQEQALQAHKSALLAAYSDGAGLPPGSFDWDERGEWTFTPAPPEGTEAEPA